MSIKNSVFLPIFFLVLFGILLFVSFPGCKASLNGVSFDTNSIVMSEEQLMLLNEAGERLKVNPSLRVTLRGYFASERSKQSQVFYSDGTPALSAARAQWCTQYLMENYDVVQDRITIEYRDAKKDTKLYGFVEVVVK